jgi:hypothetical protein
VSLKSRINSILFCIRSYDLLLIAFFFLQESKLECIKGVPKELANREFYSKNNSIDNHNLAQKFARIICILSYWLPIKYSCLHKSITFCRLLRRYEVSHVLKLGIDPNNQISHPAHAWVCVDQFTYSWGVSPDAYKELS